MMKTSKYLGFSLIKFEFCNADLHKQGNLENDAIKRPQRLVMCNLNLLLF